MFRGLVWRTLAALTLGVLLASGLAAPANAKWMKAETPHFVLYSDGPEAGLRRYAADLEDFDALLRSAHGLDPNGVPARKLDIYLVGGERDLARVLPTAYDGLAGIYRANLGDIYAAAIRGETGTDQGRRFLFHEYVHHFMLQNFSAAYPAWLVEGYADYFGATHFESDRIEVGGVPPGRARSLANETWLPLSQLAGMAAPIQSGEEGRKVIGIYYGQSWLLTHYMLSDPARRARLAEYLRAVGRGDDPVKALETAIGTDLVTAQATLRTYVRATPGIRYPRPDGARADIVLSTLPASADELLLENQRLKSGVPAADRAEFLKLIRARAARFPGDRLADLTLARAEITFGDRTAGEAILQRRIAADATDVDALWLMALSRLFAGQAEPARRAEFYAQARPWLGKAFALDGARYQILYDYAQARSVDADFPTDNTLAVLLKAHALAPQVAPVTIGAARGLMKRRRFDDAVALLTPLANGPHGGGAARLARRMIDQARAGQADDAAGPNESDDGAD